MPAAATGDGVSGGPGVGLWQVTYSPPLGPSVCRWRLLLAGGGGGTAGCVFWLGGSGGGAASGGVFCLAAAAAGCRRLGGAGSAVAQPLRPRVAALLNSLMSCWRPGVLALLVHQRL
jgi:hypothetical protein